MMNQQHPMSGSALWDLSRPVSRQRRTPSGGITERPRHTPESPGHHSGLFCTLDEVAAELGVSREQARMIEQAALNKCRAFCKARKLRMEDLLGV
jgi:hypothetical protein